MDHDIIDTLLDELGEYVKARGKGNEEQLRAAAENAKAYARARMEHVATIDPRDPNYPRVLRMEGVNILSEGAVDAVRVGDQTDAEIAGAVQYVIGLGAKLLTAF